MAPGVPIILRGHEGWLKSAVFNAAGTRVLTLGDLTARVWNADGSGEPAVLRGHENWVMSAVFNAAGTRVLTASYDRTARLWNADGCGEPVVVAGHEDGVDSAVFDADDMKILTCSGDKTARVWARLWPQRDRWSFKATTTGCGTPASTPPVAGS